MKRERRRGAKWQNLKVFFKEKLPLLQETPRKTWSKSSV